MISFVGTREAFRYMGLLAVIGGIIYGLLHLLWLRKFDINLKDEDEGVESGEAEKLTEPKYKDQGTTMSQERLSLMIKYNQIGSLTSLPRGSKVSKFAIESFRMRIWRNLAFARSFLKCNFMRLGRFHDDNNKGETSNNQPPSLMPKSTSGAPQNERISERYGDRDNDIITAVSSRNLICGTVDLFAPPTRRLTNRFNYVSYSRLTFTIPWGVVGVATTLST